MTAYQRLNDLIIHMCDESFQATLPNLAQAMGVYEQQLKQDIEYLLNYKAPKGNLLFAPHIKITLLDNEPCYHMDGKVFIPQGKLLSMTPSQFALYQHATYVEFESWLLTDSDYSDILGLTVVSNQSKNDFYTTDLLTVEKAIQMGASIKLSNSIMTPHFIKRDANTGVLYVIETDEEDDDYDEEEDDYIVAIPLHEKNDLETDDLETDYPEIEHPLKIVYKDSNNGKITPIGINSDNIYDSYINNNNTESNRIAIPKEITTRVDSIWSFDKKTLDSVINVEPTHIKLMILEDNADIIERVKMDTYGRTRAKLSGPFQSKDDSTTNIYYYVDDVLGLEAFKKWIRKFGSSMIVLEPKELAYDIYRELPQ